MHGMKLSIKNKGNMVRAKIITYVLVLSKELMSLHARGRLILINLLFNYGKQECSTSCVMKLDKITHITKAINLVLFFLCFTSKVSIFYCMLEQKKFRANK